MFKLGRNETADLVCPFYIINFVFLLQESFDESLYHWNVVPHDFFDAEGLIVDVANFFPQVSDDVEVLGNDVA